MLSGGGAPLEPEVRPDLPNFARRVYIDHGRRLTECINAVFGADAALLEYQQIRNAPNVDTSENMRQLGARAGTEEAFGTYDTNRGPRGTVFIASELATLPPDLAFLNQQRTYVHELGNVLDARLNPYGKNGRGQGYVYGDPNAEHKDTGQQLEDCVYKEGKYGPRPLG